jgi:hypothetical protein
MATYKGREIDLTPTSAMAAEGKRALAWRREGNKGGTSVGLARARQLSNRQELSPDTVRRMFSFFSRHEVDKKAEGFRPGEKGYPSPGRVAWAMWGGDAGFAWSRAKRNTLERIDGEGREKAAPDGLQVGDFVRWRASGGTAQGRIDRVVRDGKIDVPDSSFTITGTPDDPAALITVWREGADGWAATDRKVGHKFSTLTKITSLARKSDGASTTRHVSICKVDAAKKIVYGEVYAPFVLDTYGEFMLPDDIEKMAHRFMRLDLQHVIDTQHDNLPNGSHPIESFIAREGDPDYTPGAWVLGVKVSDEMWPLVEGGQLNGFSFQSLVKPKEVEVVYSVVRDHVGATEEGLDHQHVYYVQVDSMGNVVGGKTDAVQGHSHEIKRASVTEVTAGHSHRFFL